MPTSRTLFVLLLLSGVCAALFCSVLLRPEPTLSDPVYDPRIDDVVQRNAVREKNNPLLSSTLTDGLHLHGRYEVAGDITIPAGATVIIDEGTFAMDRDAVFHVLGTLIVRSGTFFSNQFHPSRQYWHGFLVEQGAVLQLEKTDIADATSAVSCASNAHCTVTNSRLHGNVVGVTTLPGSTTQLRAVTLTEGRVGIQHLGGTIQKTALTFTNLVDNERDF